jgi:signal transduction histidine kinase
MNTEPGEQVIVKLFNVLPQPAFFMIPILDKSRQKIVDFEYKYCNDETYRYLGITEDLLLKTTLFTSQTVREDELRKRYFKELVEVLETGKKATGVIYNQTLKKYYSYIRTKVEDGVLTIIEDRNDEYKLIYELEKQTKQLEAEKEFSNSILNASQNGICTVEAIRNFKGEIKDFVYRYVNDVYTAVLGNRREEVVGTQLLHAHPGLIQIGGFEVLRTVVDKGEPVRAEMYYDKLDKWFFYSAVKSGKNGVVITFQDITEKKNATLKIEQQKNLLDSILKSSPSGISVVEAIRDNEENVINWKIISINDAAATFSGHSKEDLLGKTLADLNKDFSNSPLWQASASVLETGEPSQFQLHHEPTKKWLEFSLAKMDENHLINVCIDVTAAKKSQIELEKSVEALKRSNANLEEFAYAASHDLKEPIRKVRTFSERLKDRLASRLDEQETQMFERMERATERMELLVEDLLNYSHVSERPRQLEEIDLKEKIQRVLEDLEMIIAEKGAKITVGPLPTIHAHRRQIQQLFQNLISNAIKYSKVGVAPELHITSKEIYGKDAKIEMPETDENKRFYMIEVADNGIGFEQKYADRIFQMFQRLHGKNEYGGTGVGLSIARKVVENHHGYIFAESEPGVGSTFKVLLPVN